jgi:thioesterase domain-containing protein
VIQTDDIATRLRAGLAQVIGVPLHYGLLAALCRVGARHVAGGRDSSVTIRLRRSNVGEGREASVTFEACDAVGSARAFIREVAYRLERAGAAVADTAIDGWEIEVRGAARGPRVLQPHDPTQAGEWRISSACAQELHEPLGDAWRQAASELADRLTDDPIVDVTRLLAGRPMFGASGVVLTLIHGADGSVVPFAPLAARLPFAVRAFRGLPSQLAQAADLTDLARRYTDALCDIDDQPFHWIGGHSFGAVVAREMALLLEKRGKRLGVLVCLDPSLALVARERSSDVRTELVTLLKAVFPAGEADRFLAESPSDSDIEARLRQRIPGPRLRQVLDMRQQCLELLRSYHPGAAPAGRVCYLHAREPLLHDWHALALGQRAQGVEVPGNHFSMLSEPHVASVASIVQSLCPGPYND